MKSDTGTQFIMGGFPLEHSSYVLTRSTRQGGKVGIGSRLGGGCVEDVALDTKGVWDLADVNEGLVCGTRFRAKCFLKADGRKTDTATEKYDDKAKGDLFPPCLACWTILQTTHGF
jgi:hypothetical protein